MSIRPICKPHADHGLNADEARQAAQRDRHGAERQSLAEPTSVRVVNQNGGGERTLGLTLSRIFCLAVCSFIFSSIASRCFWMPVALMNSV